MVDLLNNTFIPLSLETSKVTQTACSSHIFSGTIPTGLRLTPPITHLLSAATAPGRKWTVAGSDRVGSGGWDRAGGRGRRKAEGGG